MAYPIVWSGLVGSPRRFEVGVQLTRQDVAVSGQATARVEWAVFVRSPYQISEVADLYWTAGYGSSWQVSGESAPAVAVDNSTLQIGTIGVDLPVTSRTPLDWWLWVGLDGIGVAGFGSRAEVDLDGYVWFATPPAPTGVTAARVSDYRVDLSWTLPQNNAARVENVVISRWDAKTGVTKTIKTLGYATSYQDRTTEPNNRYLYSIQAKNRSAASGTAQSGYVSTKPAPPGSVAAARTVSGDVQVTWVNLMRVPGVTEVWDNPNGNYANTTKVGEVAWPGTSWTGAASTTQTHVYYLKHRTADLPSLTSDDSPDSNAVALPSPPLAPSGVGPAVMDPADLTPIVWTHQTADTTGQQAYEAQYRQTGTSTWTTTGKIASSVSSWVTLGTGIWAPGITVDVQVRTWGVHANPGPWSPTSVVRLDGKPAATIQSPTGTVNASKVAAVWAFFDPEGTAQSAATVELLDADAAVVETAAVDGPAGIADLVTRLADGATYTIRVMVRDGAGLWSDPATSAIAVDYLQPPAPAVQAAWVPDDGAVTLTLTHTAATAGQVAADLYEVWRGGVLVATGLAPEPGAPVTITDPIPPISGLVYQVIAWSALPSSAITEVVMPDVPAIANRIWVNGGPGWSEVACLIAGLKVDVTTERARNLEHYSGRRMPVETIGEAVTEHLKVSGLVAPGADHAAFARIQLAGTTVCVRWPEGLRFVSMGPVDDGSSGRPTGHAIGFSATTVDHQEG